MDHRATGSSQNYLIAPKKKVQIIYYLSYRGGLLEQPHLLEVSLHSSSRRLCLRDVKTRLTILRGQMMPSSFSWSYKRSYKEGYVWQDLESDNDLIFPTHTGSECVIKGCRIEASCTMEQIQGPSNMPQHYRANVHSISTAMHPSSRLPDFPALPTMALSGKATTLNVATQKHANKSMLKSPSATAVHGCENNIRVNLGVIEGLEQLHLAKEKRNLHYDNAESLASISMNHIHNAMEQKKKNVRNFQLSKLEPGDFQHQTRGPIIERQQFNSSEVPGIKKLEGDSGSCFNLRPFIGADVATQTGDEDDETTDIVDEHGKGKELCLSDFDHEDKLPCPENREGSFLKRRISFQSALIELSREEVSPPPCSTSSSSTTMLAHSASSCNAIGCSVNPIQNLRLKPLSSSVKDHKLQRMNIFSSLLNQSDKEALLSKEMETSKFTLDSNCNGREIPSLSTEYNENLSSDAPVDDRLCKDQKSPLNSSKIKPHAISMCSSGRFLHLVSCGKGLEAIEPSQMCNQRSSSIRSMHANVSEAATSRQHSFRLDANSEEYPSLDLFSNNANTERETETNVVPRLSIAFDHVPGKLFQKDYNILEPSRQGSSHSSNKLWHLRGWVHSHNRKKRNTYSKSISTDSAADQDPYTCLDLFEKHVAKIGGRNAEDSSAECRLIRVRSAEYSPSSHKRSSSYGNNPNTNPINEWVASPLQRPQIGSWA